MKELFLFMSKCKYRR